MNKITILSGVLLASVVTVAATSLGPSFISQFSLATLISGENQDLNELYTSDSGVAVLYTTTGDKNVKSSAGELVGVLSNSGTSVTVAIYDDADGTCNSNQTNGTITLTNGAFVKLPSRHSNGICVTVGGTSPNITVYYK